MHQSLNFVDWLANHKLPWAAYHAFMSSRLIALDKQPVILPSGVGGTWRCLFGKCVLKVTGPKATNACQDYQLCSVLKAVVDVSVHGVQAICDANLST